MDIEKLQETLAAATPGPWHVDGLYVRASGKNHYWQIADASHYGCHFYSCEANAALIAMAPDLAAEVIRLERQADIDADAAAGLNKTIDMQAGMIARLTAERDAAVAASQALMVRVEEARGEADILMAEAVEFCRRVDAGEIRSKRTYAAFAAIIEKRLAGGAA